MVEVVRKNLAIQKIIGHFIKVGRGQFKMKKVGGGIRGCLIIKGGGLGAQKNWSGSWFIKLLQHFSVAFTSHFYSAAQNIHFQNTFQSQRLVYCGENE